MGKTITQQARGRGGPAYRVRRQAYKYRIGYPSLETKGNARIIKLINSTAHSAPIAKIMIEKKIFFIPAVEGSYEGQEIEIYGKAEIGNILKLKDIPVGKRISNIEAFPGSGGKFMRSAGSSAIINAKSPLGVEILINNKRTMTLNENCRAVIGVISGEGRLIKPWVKAGKKHHFMASKGRKWHRTSAIKTNAVDHPFGSGRGKRIKSKIAKRNAPPGAKVGHLRPRRTGRVK